MCRRRRYRDLLGRLAQLGERRPYKAEVGGSSPSAPTRKTQLRVYILTWERPSAYLQIRLVAVVREERMREREGRRSWRT